MGPGGTASSFQGDETTKPEPFLDGFDSSDLEWKLHEGALGYGTVERSTDEPWMLQSAPESPVIFTMNVELVLRDPVKELDTWKLAWRLDDCVLASICYAHDVVLAAASVAAAEVMVAGVIEMKEVGLTDSEEEIHWRSYPKMVDARLDCVVGRGAGLCGIEGVFGWRCASRDCAQIRSSEPHRVHRGSRGNCA